jgi:8-oxo-dGTP pyrophosphatase MutT (NUDIX family)
VALIHQRKLGIWIQLGGHADGERDLAQVALREAREESGLTDLSFFTPKHGTKSGPPFPFDLDVLVVPGRPEMAEHIHYDVRYLLLCPEAQPLEANPEAHEVAWLTIDEAMQRCLGATTMMRQLRKLLSSLGISDSRSG